VLRLSTFWFLDCVDEVSGNGTGFVRYGGRGLVPGCREAGGPDAAHAPTGGRHFLRQAELEAVDGAEALLVLGREDHAFGQETLAECVLRPVALARDTGDYMGKNLFFHFEMGKSSPHL